MTERVIVIVGSTVLLFAVVIAAVTVMCHCRRTLALSNVPVAQTLAEARVKAVERKAEPMERIREREDVGTPTAGKEASLTLRPLLRAVQPHEIRSDSFGGLGAVPPDKENIVGGDNRGFATRS